MQKITPFLWFDGKAEEAMNFYVSIFKNSKVGRVTRYGEGGPGPKGTVMSATFQLDGQEFFALNGGPQFTFTPAISLMIDCEDQAEIDHFWAGLVEGGKPGRCGWLVDRFGVSWQVVPKALPSLLSRSPAVMKAMLGMEKLNIAALERAGATQGEAL